MRVRVRYAGLRNRVRVTDGHEAEAKAAQLRKDPSRVGLFVLRVLGFRGQVAHRGHGRRRGHTSHGAERQCSPARQFRRR